MALPNMHTGGTSGLDREGFIFEFYAYEAHVAELRKGLRCYICGSCDHVAAKSVCPIETSVQLPLLDQSLIKLENRRILKILNKYDERFATKAQNENDYEKRKAQDRENKAIYRKEKTKNEKEYLTQNPSHSSSQIFTPTTIPTSGTRQTFLLRDSETLQKANEFLKQGLKCYICAGPYEHIANGLACSNTSLATTVLSLDQQNIIKANNKRIFNNIRQREKRHKQRIENPEVYENNKAQNRERKAIQREDPANRLAERLRAQELIRQTPRPVASSSVGSLKRMRPETLIPEAELQALDDTEDFLNPAYKVSEGEIYNRLCKYLSFEYLTNNCCTVCERDKPKSFTTFVSVDDETFMTKLRRSVGFTPFLRERMPLKVQQEYSLERFDQRLQGIVLSKFGLYRGSDKSSIDYKTFESEEDIHLCLCKDCKDDIEEPYKSNYSRHVPPASSILAPPSSSCKASASESDDSESEPVAPRLRKLRITRKALAST